MNFKTSPLVLPIEKVRLMRQKAIRNPSSLINIIIPRNQPKAAHNLLECRRVPLVRQKTIRFSNRRNN